MRKIVISPFSQKLRNGNENPKNFPFWDKVINELKDLNFHITQIGRSNEMKLSNVDDVKFDLPLSEIKHLILNSDLWISVDNFLPHFCNTFNSRGIVIFSQSDPLIFGYEKNINLLKHRKYLRVNQFNTWEECVYNLEAYVSPSTVVNSILNWRK